MMPDKWLLLFLRTVGWVTVLAFGAAVMPEKWIVEIAEELGFDPFPHSPLTFYLARNLSLLYGFAGCLLLIIASDLERYRPLVRWTALAAIAFGILKAVVDSQSGMPWWWIAYESISSIVGGVIMFELNRRSQLVPTSPAP
jgi:hypothetical protein